MSKEEIPRQVEQANRLGEPAFIRRPCIGSPAAAAQAHPRYR